VAFRFLTIRDQRRPEIDSAAFRERAEAFPMDEAAATAFFADLVAEGQAAEVLALLGAYTVVRESERSFVLVHDRLWRVLEPDERDFARWDALDYQDLTDSPRLT
jgi:hypothetical protein